MTAPAITEIYTAVRNIIVNGNPGTNISWRSKVSRPPTPTNMKPPMIVVGTNPGNMEDALVGDGATSWVTDELVLTLTQSAKRDELDWTLPGQIFRLFQRVTITVNGQNVFVRARTIELQTSDIPPSTVQHQILLTLNAPVGVL